MFDIDRDVQNKGFGILCDGKRIQCTRLENEIATDYVFDRSKNIDFPGTINQCRTIPGGQTLAIGGPDSTSIWDIDEDQARDVDKSGQLTAMDVHSTLVLIATPGVSVNNFNSLGSCQSSC